ncbi:FliO/MopB family protein [Desulfatibacillum aliphaticivorans]|uniref:FliO/MopB family protein n=1 Tax=Desulfatibacillum aliphaticivorans TaxID=218208 RepID=UPI0009FF7299|nr:flagellar biosynthetic protein FliO [Desulfatibacillum aliphaticivorans]
MNEASVPNFWMAGLQMVAMLSIVLAALFGAVFLSKRLSGKIKGKDGVSIDVLCARQMGPKKQVVLLEVLGRRILVGVGADSITRLAEFPEQGKAFSGVLDEQMAGRDFPESLDSLPDASAENENAMNGINVGEEERV